MFFTGVVFCEESSKEYTTNLFNSKVTHVEYVTRPLGSSGSLSNSSSSSSSSAMQGFGLITKSFEDKRLVHAGVVVTVTNGDRWLIHKGSDYGATPKSPDTVIVNANQMSNKWTIEKKSDVPPLNSVNDFMKKGFIDQKYNFVRPNCQTAANEMWKEGEKLNNHHLQTVPEEEKTP